MRSRIVLSLSAVLLLFALRYLLRHFSTGERVEDEPYDLFHDPYLETIVRAAA